MCHHSKSFDVDLYVIGGGSGGVRAARVAAAHGARVRLAEVSRLGGTCVIRGCVPKKLMVYAARFADHIGDAHGFGWRLPAATHDWPALKAARDAEIARLEAVYGRLLDGSGVQVDHDYARLIDAHTVELVGRGERVSAARILIATGGRPYIDETLIGKEHVEVSDDLFDWAERPARVVVAGGGYIAVEFASLLVRLGVSVDLVYRGAELLRNFDQDLRRRVHEALIADGVRVHLNTIFVSVTRSGDLRQVALSSGQVLEVERVLFAIGRSANVAGLGLAAAGVRLGHHDRIEVDAKYATSVPSICAIGDVASTVQLTPWAIRQGQGLADYWYGGGAAPSLPQHVASAVFTTPELATVGLSEEQAQAEKRAVDVYVAEFKPLKATLSGRAEKVLLKLIVDAQEQTLLGAHMLGEDAAEQIQLLAVLVEMGARKTDLDRALAIHPTMAEEWVTLRKPTRTLRPHEPA